MVANAHTCTQTEEHRHVTKDTGTNAQIIKHRYIHAATQSQPSLSGDEQQSLGLTNHACVWV